MKYPVNTGSGVAIYIPSFRKIGAGVLKLMARRLDKPTLGK